MFRSDEALNEILRLRRKLGLVVGNAFRAVGWDVRRRSRILEYSLLGLRGLDIRTIVDVGANVGQFARHYMELFPRARVLAFEPLPSAYAHLASWAEGEPRVTPFNVALGDSEGCIDMIEHTMQTVSSSVLQATDVSLNIWPAQARKRTVPVQITTLDHALEDCALDAELFIKLDVQGYEDRVIRGGTAVFRRAAAALVEVNLDPLYAGQASFRHLVDALDDVGLRYAGSLDQVLFADGHVIFFDALFLRKG
jgi:FkbM family methyltransferase